MAKVFVAVFALAMAGAAMADSAAHGAGHDHHAAHAAPAAYSAPSAYSEPAVGYGEPAPSYHEPAAYQPPYQPYNDVSYNSGGSGLDSFGPIIAGVFGLLVLGGVLIAGLAVARQLTERDGILNPKALLRRVNEAEEDLNRICDYLEAVNRLDGTRAAQLLAADDPNDAFKLELVRLLTGSQQAAAGQLCQNFRRR